MTLPRVTKAPYHAYTIARQTPKRLLAEQENAKATGQLLTYHYTSKARRKRAGQRETASLMRS